MAVYKIAKKQRMTCFKISQNALEPTFIYNPSLMNYWSKQNKQQTIFLNESLLVWSFLQS
jgi:hypothetical protein